MGLLRINNFLFKSSAIDCIDSENPKPVAIKKILNTFDNLLFCKRILREIKILRHFHHENVTIILKLIDNIIISYTKT
jgi:serine/threonine protein kinase